MRKKISILVFGLILSSFTFQGFSQLNYGAGVFYATYLDNLGINLRAEYNITDDFILAPKLDISLPNIKWGPTFLTELGAHVHYILFREGDISLYPLAGINIGNYIDFDSNPFDIDIGFGVGLCLGAGGQFVLSDGMTVFGEARYGTGRYHQFMTTVGVLIRPKKEAADK